MKVLVLSLFLMLVLTLAASIPVFALEGNDADSGSVPSVLADSSNGSSGSGAKSSWKVEFNHGGACEAAY